MYVISVIQSKLHTIYSNSGENSAFLIIFHWILLLKGWKDVIKCLSVRGRLIATLASVKVASYIFVQFGYNLATFWVTYTGANSLMVLNVLGQLLKTALGPIGFGYSVPNVNKLFVFTNGEKLTCFDCNKRLLIAQ